MEEKDKIVVTLEVSDKQRKNTTLEKIFNSLEIYDDYDVVKFKILDLKYPFNKERCRDMLTRMINIFRSVTYSEEHIKGKKIEVLIDDNEMKIGE